MQKFLDTPAEESISDQWQSQIFARVLLKSTVIYISDAPDEMVRDLHMIPAHSVDEGLEKAKNILKKNDATITAIPDGVSVVVL